MNLALILQQKLHSALHTLWDDATPADRHNRLDHPNGHRSSPISPTRPRLNVSKTTRRSNLPQQSGYTPDLAAPLAPSYRAATASTSQASSDYANHKRSRPLRVLSIVDNDPNKVRSTRMVMSGRMADVCAELDRLAALEATLH